MSAPVKGRLLLWLPLELGDVNGSAFEEVVGATGVELDAIDGGSQPL
jgi:hypothetical protein